VKINLSASYEKIIGKDIIKLISKTDKSTYGFRKTVKSTSYAGKGLPTFNFYEKGEKRRKKLKYFYTSIIYTGLFSFYHEMAKSMEDNGEYHLSILFQYHSAVCKDEIRKEQKSSRERTKMAINRHILGYGYKYEKSLTFLLLLTGAASFIYLFSGIDYNGQEINRSLQPALGEFLPTLFDWLKCLYFSLKSTTNIGQGNLLPTSNISLILSFTQGILGFIAFTVFIVAFSRRFFK
jgi:hypothetical protein